MSPTPPPAAPAPRYRACPSSTWIRPSRSSWSSARWAPATPASTTSCTPTPRPACTSPTPRPRWPTWPARSRPTWAEGDRMTQFPAAQMMGLVDRPVRYDLAESTCPALTLDDLAGPGELTGLLLGYGTSQGDAELRTLIADEAGVRADQVLTTVGASQALFLVAQDRCGPGDRVLLTSPCFPPTRIVPEALGARADVLRLRFDDGYRLPLGAVADLLTPRTRLVSVTSPQNPSGVRFTDRELRGLVAAVEDRAPDAVVLIDEIYRESSYGDAPVPPSAATLSPRVVTCSSLSKAHGAPGLRLGWLTVTDPDLYARLRNAKFLTTVACSGADELLATRVLRRRGEILAG